MRIVTASNFGYSNRKRVVLPAIKTKEGLRSAKNAVKPEAKEDCSIDKVAKQGYRLPGNKSSKAATKKQVLENSDLTSD